MSSLDELNTIAKIHLGNNRNNMQARWRVEQSPLGGRGIFTTEDIVPGEIIFTDHPLAYGPRSNNKMQCACTVCSKIICDTEIKCSKCSLVLCSIECQCSDLHLKDCDLISSWKPKVPLVEVDSLILSRALAAIRTLLLDEDQRKFMFSLMAHFSPEHGREIRELDKYFQIPEKDKEVMIFACRALDANAYQMVSRFGESHASQRGLYPVAGLLNHNCVPNTNYAYDSNNNSLMVVKASKAIPSGTEIFSYYTGILWGTPVRRAHLYKTKHFLCTCERCSDPTENGTYLAALKCFSAECSGSMLPIDPLNMSSQWECLQCKLVVPASNIGAVQCALGSLIGSVKFDSVHDLECFLLNRITKLVPVTNQIVVDLQCRIIWSFGENAECLWNELPDHSLALKEEYCRKILQILSALEVGDSHLKGLLMYHLHAVLSERARRVPHLYEELKPEIERTIEIAYNILHGDVSAPPDLELRWQYLGPGVERSQEERFGILNSQS